MTHTTSLFQQSTGSTPGWTVSSLSTHEVKQWCCVFALPLVGMFLLLLCLLLQGVFAELGPWVIFVGVKLVTKKLEKTTEQSCWARKLEVIS